MSPHDVPWLSWPEIRRLAAGFFRLVPHAERVQFREAVDRLRGTSADACYPGLDDYAEILTAVDENAWGEASGPDVDAALMFRLWPLAGAELQEGGRLFREHFPSAVEFLVRRACRGHRGLTDAAGAELGYRLVSSPDGSIRLSEETFEMYAASGVVFVLAAAIPKYSLDCAKGARHAR